ncbi:DUF441 domain-containing protein [Candidatus Schmidhempelia bombi]|jgi:uncharacterized membrane protein (DUF441 family)|uniref:UPF0756 membrane protein O970_02155 n=1 Tax=Candidatus Schmidhempelia bombi str. Bimp TaxID=1387197 RepID=A0AB94IE68_9GAMM|nr:DUF441 domain-containing protein [Candidatus Schmidhempelia bombi]TEA27760.1 DUF441 domain-containing protein [Candidatus Schmidhempelia bombi str. Bimp]
MAQMDLTFIVVLILAALCYFTHNYTVTWAVLLLFVLKVTPLSQFFPQLNKYGITIGIVILTAAMLVPLANGSISLQELLKSFNSWKSLCAILVGVFVSWLGMRGVTLMENNTTIVNGLIVGTLIGVGFFKGIPVGPLIAAGMVSLIVGKA